MAGFSDVMNSVTSISQNVRSSVDKFHGIFSSDTTNSSIRDRYNNGFYGDTTQFRPTVFSRLFDEPTYLTFRVEFDFSTHKVENMASINGKSGSWSSLDYMPEPFLSIHNNDYSIAPTFSANPEFDGDFLNGPAANIITGQHNEYDYAFYSTYRYLLDAVGDVQRARMLKQFVSALKDIQDNYPYYFTGIEGLNTLSMVRPEKGIRLDDDNNTITINCFEGLDLKITQLMQLYRKIVWDDVYQRWVLPDMMRFFNVKIYVSEIRLFHTMSRNSNAKSLGRLYDMNNTETLNATSYDKLSSGKGLFGVANNILNTALGMSDSIFGPGSGLSNILSGANMVGDTITSVMGAINGNMKLCDNAINDVMPTIVYDCKMCEFDISDTLEHISGLSSSKEGLDSPKPNIKIKVGKVYEKMFFPLQKGLENDNKKYTLEKVEDLLGIVFDDNLLTTGTKNDYINNIKNLSPTRKAVRMNSKFGEIEGDNDAEAYDPFIADKKTSLTSLVGGVAGFFGTSHDSEAVEGDYTKEIKSLYATGEEIHKSEAITSGENKPNNTPQSLHKSEAISSGESKANNIDPNQVYNPSPNSDESGLIDDNVGMYKSTAVVLGENKPNADKTRIHKSEAIEKGESFNDIKPDDLHISTATSQEREIQKIIDEEGEENVLSAATSIKKMIKYIEENDIIKSVATDDENNKKIMKTIVFENAIDSLSTATDKEAGAVRKLANMIKKEYLHESAATNMPFEKRQNIIQTFNYLNGNNYGSK